MPSVRFALRIRKVAQSRLFDVGCRLFPRRSFVLARQLKDVYVHLNDIHTVTVINCCQQRSFKLTTYATAWRSLSHWERQRPPPNRQCQPNGRDDCAA